MQGLQGGRMAKFKKFQAWNGPMPDHPYTRDHPMASSKTYLVDVGYGFSPTLPVFFSDSEDNVVVGSHPTKYHRLRRRPMVPSSIGSFSDLWTRI